MKERKTDKKNSSAMDSLFSSEGLLSPEEITYLVQSVSGKSPDTIESVMVTLINKLQKQNLALKIAIDHTPAEAMFANPALTNVPVKRLQMQVPGSMRLMLLLGYL